MRSIRGQIEYAKSNNTLPIFKLPLMDKYRIKCNKSFSWYTYNGVNYELKWCIEMKSAGYNYTEIARSIGRSRVALITYLKTHGVIQYNASHIDDKYKTNDLFIDFINPKSVLDLYAGNKSYYNKHSGVSTIYSNDIASRPAKRKNKKDSSFCMNASFLAESLLDRGKSFDVVDVDPFGSSIDCIEVAIKLANKGLIVSYGEITQCRWKGKNAPNKKILKFYSINDITELNTDLITNKTIELGKSLGKTLIPMIKKEWKSGLSCFYRVYYKIVQ